MPKALALVPLATAFVNHAQALSRATLGIIEAIWPASILQRRMTLLLSPKGQNEVGKGKTLLVLNSVLEHLSDLT